MAQFNPSMIGFQGHPEFDRDYIEVLLELRQTIITGTTRQTALESLARPHDSRAIVHWILRFLGIL
jgi:hypothetical protein